MFMEKETKKIRPIVTSRVLFISILDKIYLIALGLILLILTVNNFLGPISSPYYGFWIRVGRELLILLGLFVTYLIYNWFYKCAVKTVLCLTEKQVHQEVYIPFYKWEISIPLRKITKINTFTCFWIFRAIVIHQYHQLPLIFWTWNNQEFKDKLNELITKEPEKVENIYENKNIINKEQHKLLMYVGIVLAGIIALIGIIKFFNFAFGDHIEVAGTYTRGSNEMILFDDGSCYIDDIVSEDVTSCTWYISDQNDYEYSIIEDLIYDDYSYYYGYSTEEDSLFLEYDVDADSIEYNGYTYTK